MEEITEGLLVAFMFILVLSMGIGNILTGFSELADRRTELRTHWLPFSWLIVLLLLHLGLFWTTLDILLFEDWQFATFLYVTLGPIILYVAAGMILPRPVSGDAYNPREHYFQIARLFFLLLALLMIWSVGSDFILEEGFESSSLWNIVGLPVLLVLAFAEKPFIHAVCTVVYGVLILSFYVPLGFGVMS